MRTSDARAWFHNLALLKPAPYKPWRHSLRLAIGTGLPLFIGVLTGNPGAMIYVALGAFLTAVTVRLDPYRERFREIAISTSVGVLGCLIGPAVAGHGVMTLVMLAALGLFSGLISGYGAAFSTGAMNMLVLAVVTSHLTHTGSPWIMIVHFLSGALFVVAMLAFGALMDRDRPERRMLSRLLMATAELALVAAETPSSRDPEKRAGLEGKRRAVTDQTKAAYASLIEKRSHGRARTRYSLRAADILSLVNQLTMAIMAATTEQANLQLAARQLQIIADSYNRDSKRPEIAPSNAAKHSEALRLVARLADTIWSTAENTTAADKSTNKPAPVFSGNRLEGLGRRLVLGPEVIRSAIRLAVSMGVAVVVGEFISGNHSYWLPMTVAIVLKPDFGSVFVRAIHRSIGTLAGVAIAAGVVALVHPGIGIVAIITLFCALIPWAGLRSYAAMVTFLTPVILLMIALVVPGSAENYAEQRLVDTLVGAAIALVFGYLIWPRSQASNLHASFANALEAVGTFLKAATSRVPDDEKEKAAFQKNAVDSEFAAYRRLSDLRTQLQKLVAEPPPAGREAASWFPAVAGAERLCDRITAYAGGRNLGDPPPDEKRAERAINALAWLGGHEKGDNVAFHAAGGREKDDRFGEVEAEIAWLFNYLKERRLTKIR